MYEGYLRLGGTTITDGAGTEIINNTRARAYANAAGLPWLKDAFDCPHLPGSPTYTNPVADGAPWYTGLKPDTGGFLGVIGLSVMGDQNSTRSARIVNTITVGGVIGKAYYGPKTILLRLALIAQDDCSLAAGVDWLATTEIIGDTLCAGTRMHFLECCPTCTADETNTCGTFNYKDFWPGLPDCVTERTRYFDNVRCTGGIQVLSKPKMWNRGASQTVEMVFTAGSPVKHEA